LGEDESGHKSASRWSHRCGGEKKRVRGCPRGAYSPVERGRKLTGLLPALARGKKNGFCTHGKREHRVSKQAADKGTGGMKETGGVTLPKGAEIAGRSSKALLLDHRKRKERKRSRQKEGWGSSKASWKLGGRKSWARRSGESPRPRRDIIKEGKGKRRARRLL